ncbi:MAG: methyltransferase domain-containing protein, partial [Gammaproteobacteria bacterium]|nr:methyltransferase domain-containing protein [Gammaproteobacteria bacterium]
QRAGYPDGLSQTETPQTARIVALADAFDAMTSNRSYRRNFDVDEAISEFTRCSGDQFDPEVCEVMIKLLRDGRIIPCNELFAKGIGGNSFVNGGTGGAGRGGTGTILVDGGSLSMGASELSVEGTGGSGVNGSGTAPAINGGEGFGGLFDIEVRNDGTMTAALQRVLAGLRSQLGTLDARSAIPQVELAAGDSGAAFIVRHLEPLNDADRARLRVIEASTGAQALTQSQGYDSVCDLDGQPPRMLEYSLPRFGVSLKFAPTDFVQVNGVLNADLVGEAVAQLAARGPARVLDLFCGIGNFSLACARAGAEVVGIEGDPALVDRAKSNAQRNGQSARAAFLSANLYAEPSAALAAHFTWCDRVLIDPPRSGAGAALDLVCRSNASSVVYVSCHPASFAEDAAALTRAGFTLSKLRLFDMFPHTAHVEVLGVFERS